MNAIAFFIVRLRCACGYQAVEKQLAHAAKDGGAEGPSVQVFDSSEARQGMCLTRDLTTSAGRETDCRTDTAS
jgi:hypothetical protein